MSQEKSRLAVTHDQAKDCLVDELHPAHDLTPEAQDGVKGQGDVDLNRRRFFFPRKTSQSNQTEQSLKIAGSLELDQEEMTPEVEPTAPQPEPANLKNALIDLVRRTSAQSLLITKDMFFDLFEQELLLVSDDEGEMFLLEEPAQIDQEDKERYINKALQEVLSKEASNDIVEIVGTKNRYYYSTKSMSGNYAKLSMLVQDKDHCTMIAEVVRFECVTYPRPYSVEMLQYAPFFMSDDEVELALKALPSRQDCEDIMSIKASNDAVYLYSDQHMTLGMAKGLCEWIEVEQFANP